MGDGPSSLSKVALAEIFPLLWVEVKITGLAEAEGALGVPYPFACIKTWLLPSVNWKKSTEPQLVCDLLPVCLSIVSKCLSLHFPHSAHSIFVLSLGLPAHFCLGPAWNSSLWQPQYI